MKAVGIFRATARESNRMQKRNQAGCLQVAFAGCRTCTGENNVSVSEFVFWKVSFIDRTIGYCAPVDAVVLDISDSKEVRPNLL
jgi:hypothetical protein